MDPYNGYSQESNHRSVPPPRDNSDSILPQRPQGLPDPENGRPERERRGGKKRGGRGRRGRGNANGNPGQEGGPGPSRNIRGGGRGGSASARHDPYDRDHDRRRDRDSRRSPSLSSIPQAGPPIRVAPVVRASGVNSQMAQPPPSYAPQHHHHHPESNNNPYYDRPPPQPIVSGYGQHGPPPPIQGSSFVFSISLLLLREVSLISRTLDVGAAVDTAALEFSLDWWSSIKPARFLLLA